jgi:hypothetical protein
MADDSPSGLLILQRIRNRIIEELELTSSFEEQRRYDIAAPLAHVPSEVVCGWEDWVDDKKINGYGPPVFSEAEVLAIKVYHAQWQGIVDSLRVAQLSLDQVQELDQWKRLSVAAQHALKAFTKRGKLPEDIEV